MKKICIVTICYNEENSIAEFHSRIVEVFRELGKAYEYEIIIADNDSTDRTPQILRGIAAKDKRFKVIFNSRNFGPNRSGNNAFLQADADAVVLMSSDLQDPPVLIKDFIRAWEQGNKIVVAVKSHSDENPFLYGLRTFFYRTLSRLSQVNIISQFTGFGLYDRRVVEIIQGLKDPYPFFRGLIAEIGFHPYLIKFKQPVRAHGKSKSNFLYLYEEAMLGITSYTKIPLRLATILGFFTAFASFLIGLFYLVYKLLFWQSFSLGIAPVAIGLFFIASVQLVFLGLLGEYLSMIYTQVLRRPPVYEKERLNFPKTPNRASLDAARRTQRRKRR
jgi:glycosyltransferase involved in cell wall biosynthesis